MKRECVWKDQSYGRPWQLPHVLHCIVLQWFAPLPLVVTIIIPGSAPRGESNTVRGGDQGREGRGGHLHLHPHLRHLASGGSHRMWRHWTDYSGYWKGCCFSVSPAVMSISKVAFIKFICSRASMSLLCNLSILLSALLNFVGRK